MWLPLLIACTRSDPAPPPTDDSTTTTPEHSTVVPVESGESAHTGAVTGTTGSTAATASTGDTAPDPCETLASSPLSVTQLTGYPSSEEFAFDGLGHLVNVDDSTDSMYRTPKGGSVEVVAPYSSVEIAGTRFLPDGDLAVCDEWQGALVRLTADGASSVIAGGLVSPNSVAVRSTGDIYVGGYGEIVRIDPFGGIERIFERNNTDFDGLVLSPDELTLWINHDDGGVIGQLHLAKDGSLVSFESVADLGGGLDGATMDECGNYYVITVGGTLWRVSPSGGTQELADLASSAYTTAVRFGSGVGGWERDHIYVMDRSGDRLYDLEMDVLGAKQPHWP